ncbi:hypothetical protein BGZ47_007291 [Haplosporangium gracile]|nr:hypothetical protein BGZ47_007291 [Haplosporangium gracile]
MTTPTAQSSSSQARQSQHVDPIKKRPKVLIVGGGLGGLSLDMLLQQTDIPYEIFERTSEPKALGSAIALSAATDALFKQCNIYDEFVALGKKTLALQVIANEQRRVNYKMNFSAQEEVLGAFGHVIARPALHDLLFRQISKDRMHMGKKVLSTDDQADGAYSAVRQNLFKRLKAQNKLPVTDDAPLPYSAFCLWITLTIQQGTVCWSIILFVEELKTSTDDKNNNSGVDQEWGPEAAEAICNETLGNLIDHTPKDLISKAKLEEIVFETWIGGRTVLMGDGMQLCCLNPAGGVGCQNAMHAAIILANWINTLPSDPTTKDIENAFQSYQDKHLPWIHIASKSARFYRTMASGDNGSVPPAFQPSLMAAKAKSPATQDATLV